MDLTPSLVDLLQHFAPVFTAPTFQTFVEIVTGWILSHRHRYVTEVIFAGGNVGNGHWCVGFGPRGRNYFGRVGTTWAVAARVV